MKAAADAGPTRSDTDTKWRRGGGGGGGCGAPMPPAKTKKGEGMRGGAKSLDPRYGAPMPPPKRKSPAAAAPPPPPKPAQPYKTREVRGGGFGSVDARKAPA